MALPATFALVEEVQNDHTFELKNEEEYKDVEKRSIALNECIYEYSCHFPLSLILRPSEVIKG